MYYVYGYIQSEDLDKGKVFFHLKAKDILSYFDTFITTYKNECGYMHDSYRS